MSDVKKLFIQYFMENQCISETKLNRFMNSKTIFIFLNIGKINDFYLFIYLDLIATRSEEDNPPNKDDLLTESNRTLRNYGFAIKHIFNEVAHENFYVFQNEINDNFLGVLSTPENQLFYSLIRLIIEEYAEESDDGDLNALSIRKNKALNSVNKSNIALYMVEKIIKNWINQYWFEVLPNGNITLGIRTIVQYGSYLIDNYHLKACSKCNFVCFYGNKCSKCKIMIHSYCSLEVICPTCQVPLLLDQKTLDED